MKPLLFCWLIFYCTSAICQAKLTKKIPLSFKDPSSICHDQSQNCYYMVNDLGQIAKIDQKGMTTKQEKVPGAYDLEGLCLLGNELYLIDERFRTVFIVDKNTFKLLRSFKVKDAGALDRSYEGIFYNPSSESLTLISEQPVKIYELDYEFKPYHQAALNAFDQVSDAVFYDNFLWLLSSQNNRVYKVDTQTYLIKKSWSIPVEDAEGLAFLNKNKLAVVSDNLKTLYILDLD